MSYCDDSALLEVLSLNIEKSNSNNVARGIYLKLGNVIVTVWCVILCDFYLNTVHGIYFSSFRLTESKIEAISVN